MNKHFLSTTLSLLILFYSWTAFSKTVRYELVIENKKVNVTGKEVDFSLTVNGGIPAPTLEFTEGDDAEITVINKLPKEETSIHWHGILLPPEEDGVSYINTPPIMPGKSHIFRFRIRQHGTYWYHSHTMVQEQKGVYGAFIIHPKKPTIKADKEAVVVLSDWSDEDADQIIKNLRKDGDYYLYKKNSMRSIFGAIQAGQLKTYYANELERMGGMDLSDVGYDAFLINGKKDSQLLVAHPGERIRIRIINAAASSYFCVTLGNVPMQVISADGIDIEPLNAKELLMGMAETYDILFTVPEHKNFELRATAQDATGYASGWIGMGPKVPAPDKPQPDLYAPMDHGSGHAGMDHSKMDHSKMDHSKMDHSKMKAAGGHEGHKAVEIALAGPVIETLTVDNLKAKDSTILPQSAKVTELKLELGGDMERYVWHINGKAIHEERDILINEGDVVRFTFVNKTMMHHPMHLHGHFFRVLNANGEKSPLKHTVDVPPHGTRTIEFFANERGQWMLHCHNLYHMKTGMARVVKYMSYKPSAEAAAHEQHDPHLHDHWYFAGSAQAFSNLGELKLRTMQTWNEFDFRVESRKDDGWKSEGDLFYRRFFPDSFLALTLGGSAIHDEGRAQAGFAYVLPLLFETQVLVDHKGMLRFDVEKRFQWTSAIFSEVEYIWRQDTLFESEFSASLMYGGNWHWSAGLKFTEESIGGGFQYQF